MAAETNGAHVAKLAQRLHATPPCILQRSSCILQRSSCILQRSTRILQRCSILSAMMSLCQRRSNTSYIDVWHSSTRGSGSMAPHLGRSFGKGRAPQTPGRAPLKLPSTHLPQAPWPSQSHLLDHVCSAQWRPRYQRACSGAEGALPRSVPAAGWCCRGSIWLLRRHQPAWLSGSGRVMSSRRHVASQHQTHHRAIPTGCISGLPPSTGVSCWPSRTPLLGRPTLRFLTAPAAHDHSCRTTPCSAVKCACHHLGLVRHQTSSCHLPMPKDAGMLRDTPGNGVPV